MKRAKHVPFTEKDFRRRKRAQMNLARKVLDRLRLGCAFLPKEAFLALLRVDDALHEALAVCRPLWKGR